MTLFAALGGKSTAPTSTCSPPTAIQLHAASAIDFIGNKITNEADIAESQTSNNHQYSLLSYQAIQTHRDDDKQTHDKPDLGVWNCSLNNEFDAAALGDVLKNAILQSDADTSQGENQEAAQPRQISTNTVLMTIHLQELTDVQPTLERMRIIITTAYGEGVKLEGGRGSTSIKTLQSCSFGKSQIKQEVNPNSAPGGKIELILAVIVPSVKEQGNVSAEYQERQKQSFVVYHLHKFALELNCTLCFVREGERKEDETVSTMTIEELASVVRRVAMGQACVDDSAGLEESADINQSADGETPAAEPAIYPPGSHDAELICGAMQRNASCEGMWDASKDDLEKALPPISKKVSESAETQESKGGDEEWLEKLASSVGIIVDATTKDSAAAGDEAKPVEKKKEVKKKKTTKTTSKSEKAPSDFFASLLKK